MRVQYHVGDGPLVAVARRLTARASPGGVAARLAGEITAALAEPIEVAGA
ncbi:hypothetical protein GCM10010199_56460 [Dactylosporangium roseum]